MAPLPYDAPKVAGAPLSSVPETAAPPPGTSGPQPATRPDGTPPAGSTMFMAVAAPLITVPGSAMPDGSPGHLSGRADLVSGSVFTHQEDTPAVLGQVTPMSSKMDRMNPGGVVVSPAVLGRTASVQSAKPASTTRTRPEQQSGKWPETESAVVPRTEAAVVKTTADAPATPPTEPPPLVATAQATSAPVEPPKNPDLPVDRMTTGSSAVRHSAALQMNPSDRGMFVPNAGPPPSEVPPNPAPQGQTSRGGQIDPYAPQTGGYMSPMMLGGMGGGHTSQQGSRVTAVPNEPRPDAWDPSDAGPGALGRRAPEPDGRESPLSEADLHAQLAETLAELDRLTERGK